MRRNTIRLKCRASRVVRGSRLNPGPSLGAKMVEGKGMFFTAVRALSVGGNTHGLYS